MRQFCCWKEGWKENKGQQCKKHTNIDVQAGGKAMIQFNIDLDGK